MSAREWGRPYPWGRPGTTVHPGAIIVFGMLAYFLPNLWLSDMINKRKLVLSHSLPFHMDLLTLAVEAGLTFILAMDRVVKSGHTGHFVMNLKSFFRICVWVSH